MPCTANFSVTLVSEILSTETSDFLRQIIILKSFYSVLCVFVFVYVLFTTQLSV